MKHWLFFFTVVAFIPLGCWAVPGTLENLQFKVSLSETTPGVDDSLVPGVDPLINVDVQDKMRNSGTRYPLKAYAIQEYFFSDNLLNLITRDSPKSSLTKPLYGFLQLNLEAPDQSRQYSGIRKYYFSTDNRALMALFEQGAAGGPVTSSLGLVRWADKPASLGWIYSPVNQVNTLRAAQVPDGETPSLEGTAGWSADSLTCAFVASFSAPPATPAPGTKTYFLVRVDMEDSGIKVAASPLDPLALHLSTGATIDKVDCSGDKATLTIVSSDGTDTQQVQIPLPSSTNGNPGP